MNAALAVSPDPPPPPLQADFQAIYRAQVGFVWNSLRRLGGRERDLEDLTHEVFIAAFRAFASYDRARPLRPWLFGIAFRVASDFRRRASHLREVGDDAPDAPDEGPGSDEKLVERERQGLVREALLALDLDKRAVFVMHELEGMSMPEIAQVIEAPLNTLYSRLRLGRVEFTAAVRRLQAARGGP
jgi:RNA polymerase sigma-70 factor (ECF subfamily)